MGRDIRESHPTQYKSGFGSECANNVSLHLDNYTAHVCQ